MGDEDCYCPPSSNPNIVQRAIEKFDERDPVTNRPAYEFSWGGTIGDSDDDGMWEVDCSHLVHWAISAATSPGNSCREVPYMTTKYFNPPSGWSSYIPAWREHQANKWKYRETLQQEYFCKIEEMTKVGPGDIIVFRGHMGIVKSIEFKDGRWQGEIYHSTPAKYYIVPFSEPFDGPQHGKWFLNNDPAATDLEGTSSVVKITGFYRPKVCLCHPEPPPWPREPAAQGRLIDPLIRDLDGNGVRTIGLDANVHFDHDGNGFQELTGWVTPGNGILFLDTDGNDWLNTGREAFGNSMGLPNGMFAANGFHALAAYDSNDDGRIDANDPVWTRLKIWQYRDSELEPYDPDESGIVSTLDHLGIAAIYLDSDLINRIDAQGNTELRSGRFEWVDGRYGTVSEYRLERDTSDTIPTEFVDVAPSIEALPNLEGHGNLYDLHQALVRDTSGQLKALVESFALEGDPARRCIILEQIIFRWTGADLVAPDSAGPFIDGRKVAALEAYYGESRANPGADVATVWRETYRELFEIFYGNLMAQTHLNDLYQTITYSWNDETLQYQIDTSGLIAALQDALSADPERGKELLSEFARTRRGLGYFGQDCYLAVREAFIQQDPSLGWVFDTGGLQVYDQLGQSPDGWYHPHMFGTWGSDAVKGSLTAGDGVINGLSGDDVIYGTARNELIYHSDGDALIVAGGGRDTIWAGAGNDILDGGEGSDTLRGETGNDTYIFRVGSGRDTIIETDKTAGNVDTIWIGSFLTPDDIAVKRSGNDLVVKIIGTDDTMTVKQFFDQASVSFHSVEQIQFADGTVWDLEEILRREGQRTQGDDYLVGTAADDTIDALGGNDTVIGQAGSDTLNGGSGDDRLWDGAVFHVTACNAGDCANPLWMPRFPLDIRYEHGTISENVCRLRHVA